MKGRWRRTLGLAAGLAVALSASGQQEGLAAAAQREKERRKKTAAPAATYTDKDLPSSAGDASPKPEGSASPSPSPAAGETRQAPRDEAHWRGRATALQSAITAAEARVRKAQEDYDGARKGNIQPLPMDAMSQMPPIPQVNPEADRLQKELESAKAALASAQKALADFEEEARKAGVPPGWLR
ncbi:MAG TPA: hypothetical protein VFM88_07460 [Vicinamibacteria bacterium]|nr:hypothetical protein [Vicinamibacteria bacterium]